MDQDVSAPDRTLNDGQVFRLKRMADLLRDPLVFSAVGEIKSYLSVGDHLGAMQIWDELSDYEKECLWVAPRFGGIFTTEERKIIRSGLNEQEI